MRIIDFTLIPSIIIETREQYDCYMLALAC